MIRLGRTVGLALIAATCYSPTPGEGTPYRAWDAEEWRLKQTRAAVEDWGQRHATSIDAEAVEDIANELNSVTGNLCYPDASPRLIDICNRLLLNPARLQKLFDAYCDEVFAPDRPRVSTLLAIAAVEFDSSAEAFGWPSENVNPFGCLRFKPLPETLELAKSTPFGRSTVRHVRARYCARSGARLEFRSKSGEWKPLAQAVSRETETVVTLKAAAADSGPPSPASVRLPSALDLMCLDFNDRTGTDEATPIARDEQLSNRSWIANLTSLGIKVEALGTTCDAECRLSIASVAAEAIELWRACCVRCPPSMLAGIRYGDIVFLDEKLAAPPPFLSREAADQWLQSAIDAKTVEAQQAIALTAYTTKRPVWRYVRSSVRSDDARHLCRYLGSSRLPWVSDLYKGLCTGDPGRTLLIKVLEDGKPCGDPRFVACAQPGEGIQLTAHGAHYTVSSGADTDGKSPSLVSILGHEPADDVDLLRVLVHETGHFLGLPHLQSVNLTARRSAVMGRSYSSGMCLSLRDVNLLEHAAEDDWKFKSRGCDGLLWPEPRDGRTR